MNTLTIPAASSASIRSASDQLADVARFDDALERNANEIAAAQLATDAALEAQTGIDTKLALATDESAAKVLEGKRKKADTALDASRVDLERAVRLGKALATKREEAVQALRVEAGVLDVEIRSSLQEFTALVAHEIGAALGPLEAALRRAWALDAAVRPGFLSATLSEIVIPIPGPGYEQFIRGDRLVSGGQIGTLRYDAAKADPELVELYQAAHAPTEMLRQMNAYLAEAHLTSSQRSEQAAARVRMAGQIEAARREDAAATAAKAAQAAAPATNKGWTVVQPNTTAPVLPSPASQVAQQRGGDGRPLADFNNPRPGQSRASEFS